MKYENVKKLSPSQFRRTTGVKQETFAVMVKVLEEALVKKKERGGRPNKLNVPTMLLMTLEYLREYRTYIHIAASYGISESATFQIIRWVENTLVQCKEFRLPGKKALLATDHEFEVVLIDATESPIERPKKNNANFTPGKKKRHTLKTQVIVAKQTKKIICTEYANGKRHDFRVFKESKVRLASNILALTDTGFLGLNKLHSKTEMPKKHSKKKPLTVEDKTRNKSLSSERVLNEHVIGMIKRFKIVADKYRNRRKRFGLRFNLISGIYNYEL